MRDKTTSVRHCDRLMRHWTTAVVELWLSYTVKNMKRPLMDQPDVTRCVMLTVLRAAASPLTQ